MGRCLKNGYRWLLAGGLTGGIVLGIATGDVFAAKEISVSMVRNQYGPKAIEAKVGDTLAFVNGDITNHWVYSPTIDHQVSFGPQKPGDTVRLTLTKPGSIKIACALHANMNAAVNVTR
ncbi:MAG TPA: hypothetical protein VLG66_10360 [Alphaproteobacteria bacterium]|jgi:plastocyanin|nr:hypothetical protein [Alphaproteobacteria bacterium]